MAIGSLLKRLERVMWQDSGIDGDAQRLSQTVWILFLAVFDYKEKEWELEDDYEPIIPEGYRWRDWASCEDETGKKNVKAQRTGEDLLNFINNELFPKLRELEGYDKKHAIVREFMTEAINYAKNGTFLREAINIIDEIDFTDNGERHTFNDMYEQLLLTLNANKTGEFYTGRAITRLVTDYIDPQIGESIADFACGTGGFLVEAINHLRTQVKTVSDDEAIQTSIYGAELKQLPYVLATTNLLLHDINVPNIMHGDSLAKDIKGLSDEEKVDVVLMNPPFGGIVDKADLPNFPSAYHSAESADLFIAKILYSLKENGRCGLVLPDGFLFQTDGVKTNLKKKLLEEFNLHTVIRMPESCFAPYTGITTNLLFFEKTKPTEEVWFYRFDLPDGKKFSKTKNPMTRDKLSAIDEWWVNRVEIKDEKEDESLTETWKARKVPVSEIIENEYSLDFCGFPNEEKPILSPEETVKNYQEERERLDRIMDKKLQEILKLLEV